MNRAVAISVFVALVVFILISRSNRQSTAQPSTTFSYQGQQIRTSKPYSSYDDFKDDEENLDTNQLDLIERLITEAHVPEKLNSRNDLVHLVIDELKFPGYGAGFSGEMKQNDGSILEFVQIEVPQRQKSRYMLFHSQPGSQVRLVDNLVTNWPFAWAVGSHFSVPASNSSTEQFHIRIEGTNILYTLGTNMVRKVPLR